MLTVNETIATYGASALDTKQLVQVILGNAEKAEKLLSATKEPLRLLTSSRETLIHMGLTHKQANKILALIELVRRYNTATSKDLISMSCPSSVADYLIPQMGWLQTEQFVVLVANAQNKLIATKVVSTGTLTGAIIHQRDVFKVAIEHNGAAIVIAHNHPSGNPFPSVEDRQITHSIYEAGKVMGIPLLDHIVVSAGRYYSFQEADELK